VTLTARTAWRRITAAAVVAAVALVIALPVSVVSIPLPDGYLDLHGVRSTTIVDRSGALLYETLSPSETRGLALEADELPDPLVAATLAAEDHRFFSHRGIDPLAVARAALRNVRERRVAEGGSTITQQVVKRLGMLHYPERPRSKLREAFDALRLERRLSKREILALYLNVAPYGNQYIGARRASRGYFGTEPENLTAAQAAFLAALPQAPSRLDPYRNPAAAIRRQKRVIARMGALGLLGEDDARAAAAERVVIGVDRRPFPAPHFVDAVRREIGEGGARRVVTTLDAALQADVRRIVAASRPRLARHGAHNVAVVVLDNASAEWLAWEGSGDYFDADNGGMIDGVTTARQPGSALKPFTYAMAFDSGADPSSLLPDIPASFPTARAGVTYAPRNYDGVFRGPLRAREALAGSANVPAVALLSRASPASLLRMLRDASLTTLDRTADHYGLGLTLGNAEVRLDELVAAYAAFARGGVHVEPAMIRSVDGAVRVTPSPSKQLVSATAAFWIADILSDSRAREYAFGRGGSLDFPYQVAVKTGTSQAYRDNWTIGFTRQVTVGVWVGNFDRTPLRNSSGVTGAAPIFHAVMNAAQRRVANDFVAELAPPIVEAPAELERRRICRLSGLAESEHCNAVMSEWKRVDAPIEICSWHGRSGVSWPAEYRAWAGERGLLSAADDGSSGHREAVAELRITHPGHRSTYLIDPTLRSEFQAVRLRVTAGGGPREVEWFVDGTRVARDSSEGRVEWPLRPGRHAIAVTDAHGNRDEVVIDVR
jgi:penicillin-binding protein 1C